MITGVRERDEREREGGERERERERDESCRFVRRQSHDVVFSL